MGEMWAGERFFQAPPPQWLLMKKEPTAFESWFEKGSAHIQGAECTVSTARGTKSHCRVRAKTQVIAASTVSGAVWQCPSSPHSETPPGCLEVGNCENRVGREPATGAPVTKWQDAEERL